MERSIKELLVIVRDNVEHYLSAKKIYGLCYLISLLYIDRKITIDEKYEILNYLYNNIPNNAKKRAKKDFSNHPLKDNFDLNHFWWTPYSVAPRLRWLDKQIEILSK